jgi:hypothetical protein
MSSEGAVDFLQDRVTNVIEDMADRISGHPGSWVKKLGFADWVRDMGKRGIDGDGLLADARALIVQNSRAATPAAAAPRK